MKQQPHQYRDLGKDQLEELFSRFLIDSWSFSKVSTFSRNEKAFEMVYVYGKSTRQSASEVAGSAYHRALEFYFSEKRAGNQRDLVSLQTVAFLHIDEVEPHKWKLQKTTPTIEACKQKATDICLALLKNFFQEVNLYESEIGEVLDVEVYCDEFLTINGVDIPLPCHAKIDLVIKTKGGKVIIIDHKSKAAFADEKDLKFSIGRQAITYVNCYETEYGVQVDEVWFIENKYSQNKDKSPQLSCFKVSMDKDIRKLYEALLYEPLKRMLEATSDPDYVYLINENDSYVDKAEIYEFWAQTMIAEVSDFNVQESKKELISKRLKKIRDASIGAIDPKIIKQFRENASEFIQYDLTNKNMTAQEKIEHTLRTLGTIIRVAHTIEGYSSNTYLLEVSAGTTLSSVYGYRLDIANALNVSAVRMSKDLYVHEGKSYISVESSKPREMSLMFEPKYLDGLRIPLGVDNFNRTIVWDLNNPSTPHMLICGSTGSGKSVSIISTLEYAKLAGIKEIVIFDPKREFTQYKGSGIDVYNDIEDIEAAMALMVEDMNTRARKGINNLTLVIFDEFADAVANSRKGKDLNKHAFEVQGNYKDGSPKMKRVLIGQEKSLEENLRILLQKGRSSGFRVIAATQRASVKVITGDAKVNFPVQICFKVPKEVDSKVVLDEPGAESLSGKGDGLIKSPEYPGIVRFQAFYKPQVEIAA
jgi:DNA segregation ATPase FtsK/SpoIIIE, S-DNA-T family